MNIQSKSPVTPLRQRMVEGVCALALELGLIGAAAWERGGSGPFSPRPGRRAPSAARSSRALAGNSRRALAVRSAATAQTRLADPDSSGRRSRPGPVSRRWPSEAQAQEDRPIQSACIGFESPGKRTPKASTAMSAYRPRAVASGPVRPLRFLAKALNRSALGFGDRRGSLISGSAGVCG